MALWMPFSLKLFLKLSQDIQNWNFFGTFQSQECSTTQYMFQLNYAHGLAI